jgi:FdhE protein
VNVSAERTDQKLSQRIARAWLLARERPATADLLTFYGNLVEFQQARLRESPRVVRAAHTGAFADTLDPETASLLITDLLRWLDAQPQQGLAGVTEPLRHRPPADWIASLKGYWDRGGASLASEDEVEQFVAEALLQPFAEYVADSWRDNEGAGESDPSQPPRGGPRCPVCHGHPIVATLRERGHGARRSLVCGFCLSEWSTPRAVCPFCGEDDGNRLLVYRAEEFPDIRIESCRSCSTYIKTIDLTVNGAAIHLVDDLASLAMDLWAAGRGYRKVRPNLLRL